MDKSKQGLRGSPNRDAFKQWHKKLDSRFYACDLDLVLVDKNPPGIAAAIDYKTTSPYEYVTFAEVLAYNDLLSKGIRVYIVIGDEPFEELTIYQYMGGDWKPEPPKVDLELIARVDGLAGFSKWEREVRQQYRTGRLNA